MSFRTRLLVALLVVVLVPLLAFALGLRREMDARLTAQYQQRVTALVDVIHDDLAQENASIADRLATLSASLADDNRFRVALNTPGADRMYLLDYAGRAMRLAGLSMLQIQDSAGRIISSGHFRNEYDRLEPELPLLLAGAEHGMAIVQARSPEGPFLVLARMDSVRIAGHRFTVVGGLALDRTALQRLARGPDLGVTLISPAGVLSSDSVLERDTTRWLSPASDDRSGASRASTDDFLVAQLTVPFVDARNGPPGGIAPARLVVTHPLAPLRALRHRIDVWFLASLAATVAIALLLGVWASARVSRPLTELADKTASVDLDNLDVHFASDRDDEIGTLSRLLNAMVRRLKASASRLRDAERRATVGELARQVNHDIKNGLTPIRNVVRHLAQVSREHPDELPLVFTERQGTLESSIAYLESLAKNYARLSPQLGARPCDVNAVVQQVVRNAQVPSGAELRVRLTDPLPSILGDEVVVRRILENLVGNAIDSLESRPGSITVSTETRPAASRHPVVCITVADTGCGMTEQQLARAFDDFYTTKPFGTGLGLSVVRRLVVDLNGSLHVDTAPGQGTRFIVELPAMMQQAPPRGAGMPADVRPTTKTAR